jgi:E3 ubiquitin-protein ligase UBR7
LDPLKLEPNDKNAYNQNFSGVYCTCHRPYPDPEDDIKDQMIQCTVCEDWYHTRHLDAACPNAEEYSEMICGQCMEDYAFLKKYYVEIPNANVSISEKSTVVDVEKVEEATNDEGGSANKKLKMDICKKPSESTYMKGAAFWVDGWRKNLCTCTECMQMYTDLKIDYLLNEEDTVQWYEENGKNHLESADDREMRALSSLDRVRQVDAITEYNRMKEKLMEYLNTFVVNQQVVTEADIKQFFTTFKNDKDGPKIQPNFCR